MAQSLSAIYLHVVFSTKQRQPFMVEPAFRQRILSFLVGVTRQLECPGIAIGGVEDHAHLLVRFSRTLAPAQYIKEIKRLSSLYAKQQVPEFAWQAGYGVFSVDAIRLDQVAEYVLDQEEHHRTVSFQEEFRRLLDESGTEYDERYVWD